MDLNREVWEGWTVQHFINNLEAPLRWVMGGESWQDPLQNKEELKKWLREEQPYHKKDIPEVIKFFADKYNLK